MEITWGMFWQKSRKWLKTGWLITAALVAIYVGAVQPMNNAKEIAAQREAGLGSVQWDPVSMWRAPFYQRLALHREPLTAGVAGGAMEKVAAERAEISAALSPSAPPPPEADDERKLIRTSALDLIVKNPADASERVRQLAEHMGGFLVSSETNGGHDSTYASLTIRVPAARFEEARAEIRKLGPRVDGEKVEAQDVTKQYVDQGARLRNLRAQEAQYLTILKQSQTVKDTLEVSDKLNAVRGQIEQQQAEFDALTKQVETVAITISLRSEAEAQVFGLQWRPLYRLKLAAREGLDGLADYAVSMSSFLFYLPAILLWLATILIGAAVGWRILRWAGRTLFSFSRKEALAKAS